MNSGGDSEPEAALQHGPLQASYTTSASILDCTLQKRRESSPSARARQAEDSTMAAIELIFLASASGSLLWLQALYPGRSISGSDGREGRLYYKPCVRLGEPARPPNKGNLIGAGGASKPSVSFDFLLSSAAQTSNAVDGAPPQTRLSRRGFLQLGLPSCSLFEPFGGQALLRISTSDDVRGGLFSGDVARTPRDHRCRVIGARY